MSESGSTDLEHRMQALLLIGGLICLALCFTWHQSRAEQQDLRLERQGLQSWMVEALPGIGPKTYEMHFEALKAGNDEQLPKRARAILPQVLKE